MESSAVAFWEGTAANDHDLGFRGLAHCQRKQCTGRARLPDPTREWPVVLLEVQPGTPGVQCHTAAKPEEQPRQAGPTRLHL